MNQLNMQFAELLRKAGSDQVIEALAEYCEQCAEQLVQVDKKRRAEAFVQAAEMLTQVRAVVAIAERPSKAIGESIVTLADAAEEQAMQS